MGRLVKFLDSTILPLATFNLGVYVVSGETLNLAIALALILLYLRKF